MTTSDVHPHGRLAGGKFHRVATTVEAGFMSALDKAFLDDLRAGTGSALTGVTAGTYGDSTHVGQFTVGIDGRLTSATDVAIAFPAGDSVLVNLAATVDANLNDTTPAAPANSVNTRWQSSGSSPTSVSTYLTALAETSTVTDNTSTAIPIDLVLSTGTVSVRHKKTSVTAGSAVGNGSNVAQVTFNNTGHCTAVASVSIAINANQIIAGTLVGARGGTDTSSTSTGDILRGSGPSSWVRLAIGANGTVLTSNGTTPAWGTLAGISFGTQTANTFFAGPTTGAAANPTFRAIVTDDYLTSTSTATGVTNTKLRQSVGVSVIGRSANSTGAPADIAAASDSQVLMRRSSTVGFNQLLASEVSNDSKEVSVAGYDVDQVAEALSMQGSVQGWKLHSEHLGGLGSFDAEVSYTVTTVVGTGFGHLGTQVTTKEHPGVAYLTTQATDDGVCAHLGVVNMMVGGGYHYGETIITFDALNPTTTQYWYLFGLSDSITSNGYPANGIYFLYDKDNINGDTTGTAANWHCVTQNAGTNTSTDSGVAVATSSSTTTWANGGDQRLRYEVKPDGSEVKFYINGTLAATHTTNIPATTTAMAPEHKVVKNSGVAGRVWVFIDETLWGGLITLTSGERG